jgi:hypothetical protein
MKYKKILLIGNANNEMYRVAKYLEFMGIRSNLVLLSNGSLNDPNSLKGFFLKDKLVELTDWREFSEEEVITNIDFFQKKITPLVLDSDAIIANQYGPALLASSSNKFFIYISGSDLTHYCNENFVAIRTSSWEESFKRSSFGNIVTKQYRKFQILQILGFQKSIGLITSPHGLSKDIDDSLESIGCSQKVRFSLITGVNLSKYDKSSNKRTQKRILHRTPRIFIGSRLTQKSSAPSDLDDKGTERLLDFLEYSISRGFKGKFIFFKKGIVWEYFYKQLNDRQLMQNIIFYDEMPYKHFIKKMLKSDLIVDSLGDAIPGRISHDALTLMKAVVSNITLESQRKRYGTDKLNFMHVKDKVDFFDIINDTKSYQSQKMSSYEISNTFDPIKQLKIILPEIF